MIVDTSALVAIALEEPLGPALSRLIRQAQRQLISSVSLLEAGIVLRARVGESAVTRLYQLVQELEIEVVPFDENQAQRAIAAFGRFGKGMGHRAQLNFGDCAVYALGILRGEPILATGRDFAATDLTVLRP